MSKMDHPVFRSTFHKYRKIVRAIFARCILIGHSTVAVYLTVQLLGDVRYYGIYGVAIPLFLGELAIILYAQQGCEWRRICTPFIVYLISTVPTLWLQRLHVTQHHGNTTSTEETTKEPVPRTLAVVLGIVKSKNSQPIPEILQSMDWTKVLEQSMMFVLILCRWILPRGHIDRNSLSQLLIMYSAISADILDFSDIFQVEEIKTNKFYMYIGLAVWSWSMVQFTLVVTTAFSFRRKPVVDIDGSYPAENSDSWDKSEALSILMVFFMQDGPFLIVRLYAIFYINMIDYYTILFFSLKNILTLILGLYRLMVLLQCVSREGNDLLSMEEIAKSKESLATIESEMGTKKNGKLKNKSKSKESLSSIKPANKMKRKCHKHK